MTVTQPRGTGVPQLQDGRALQQLADGLRERLASRALGRPGAGPRAAHRAGQAAAARPGGRAARPGLAVPGAVAAGR